MHHTNYFWAFMFHIFKYGLGNDGMTLHLVNDDGEWVLHDTLTDNVDTYYTKNELENTILKAIQQYIRRK